MKNNNQPVKAKYFLKPGFIFVPLKSTTISAVLGSCVSVCVYDKKRKTGGMNHFQYPNIKDKNKATARYGNVSTWTLINMMVQDGSKIKNIEAQIIGGAYNPEISSKNIGSENIKIARQILSKKNIRIVSEDIGGEKGRKIIYQSDTNEIAIIKVDKLRQEDWYPYESNR